MKILNLTQKFGWLALPILLGTADPAGAQPLAPVDVNRYAGVTNAVFDQSGPDTLGWIRPDRKRGMMNSPGRGILYGFVIGAAGGVALGLSGEDWVLDNGKVVPRPVHAIVDAFIVAAPLMVMGAVIGGRQDRSTLSPSKFHVAVGGGWASVMTYGSIRNAYIISGIPHHIPHWFGYLHYPNGRNSSTPYTWNLAVDYNLTRKVSLGFSFNNFVKQEIKGGLDHHSLGPEYEFAKGESYSLLADYVLNPIIPENRTRLVFAAGAGASLHNLLVGGSLGGPEYQVRRYTVTPHFRGTCDYYARRNLSLQLKVGYKPRQYVRVPEQTLGPTELIAHAVNFRSLDVTLGVRYHTNFR